MQQVNRENIKYILETASIVPTKEKGQNFLVEPNISEKIANLAKIDANSKVIEVGPGLGSLTYYLEKKANNYSVIDVDERVINYLSYELDSRVNIIYNDALKYDFKDYDIVISNLPYSITKELIVHLLISARKAKQFVFMCQKENFYHFFNTNGSEYGPSSILIHLLGNIKKEFDVSPSNFIPMPKCQSTVFTVFRNEEYDLDIAIKTYKVASKLFNARRKTILNNLSSLINKEEAIKILETLNIGVILRPEEIAPNKFYELTKLLMEKGL